MTDATPRAAWPAVVLVFLASACGAASREPVVCPTNDGRLAEPPVLPAEPVEVPRATSTEPSVQSVSAFGERLIQAVRTGEGLEGLVDWRRIYADRRSGLNDAQLESLVRARRSANLLTAIHQRMTSRHDLRGRAAFHDSTLVFRLRYYDGRGAYFFDFRIEGERAVDIYTLAHGTWLSAAPIACLDAAAGGGVFRTDVLDPRASHARQIQEAARRSDWARVRELFSAMPAELQREPVFVEANLVAASRSDEGEHVDLLRALVANEREKDWAHWLAMYGLSARDNYRAARRSARWLNLFFPDPIWILLEGDFYGFQSRDVDAIERLLFVRAREPDLLDVHELLLVLGWSGGRMELASESLRTLEEHFDSPPGYYIGRGWEWVAEIPRRPAASPEQP